MSTELEIDDIRLDWKTAPIFPPDFVRATLSFVFKVDDHEVHVAVVDEDVEFSGLAERSATPRSIAAWLTGRRSVVVHGIRMTVFWEFWRQYTSKMDHPLGTSRGSPVRS